MSIPRQEDAYSRILLHQCIVGNALQSTLAVERQLLTVAEIDFVDLHLRPPYHFVYDINNLFKLQ